MAGIKILFAFLICTESSSLVEWYEPEELIQIMKRQGLHFHDRIDADESEIVRRAIPYIQQKDLR